MLATLGNEDMIIPETRWSDIKLYLLLIGNTNLSLYIIACQSWSRVTLNLMKYLDTIADFVGHPHLFLTAQIPENPLAA
jgi:hypothetical protein